MRAYCLILMAGAFAGLFLSQRADPLAQFLCVRAEAAFATLTLRHLIIGAGTLLIVSLVWQLAGFDLAFVFAGEALAYLEIAAAVLLAATRLRFKRLR